MEDLPNLRARNVRRRTRGTRVTTGGVGHHVPCCSVSPDRDRVGHPHRVCVFKRGSLSGSRLVTVMRSAPAGEQDGRILANVGRGTNVGSTSTAPQGAIYVSGRRGRAPVIFGIWAEEV